MKYRSKKGSHRARGEMNRESAATTDREAVIPATETLRLADGKQVGLPGRRLVVQSLPVGLWIIATALALAGVFTANPVLTPCAIMMVPVLASLLWFPGEPPALLFACLVQWLQATIAVFYTDWHGTSLQSAFGGTELYLATWLSMIGILVLAVGIRLVLLWPRPEIGDIARRESKTVRVGAVFAMYLATYVVLYVVVRLASGIGGLQQPLGVAASLKWVLVFLIAYTVLEQRRQYGILFTVAAIEFATGLLGYFSSFKSVFFVLLVALPTAGYFFRGWRLVQFCSIGAVVIALLLVWTAIKPEYREFLNQGSRMQVVMVPIPQRVEKLVELVDNLDRSTAEQAFDTLILRVSYVNFFALTIGHVPSTIPHERGALWLGAVKHVLMPRMFYPDKPVIDDSERTTYYSGLQVAGAEEGTSISIGYMGESYIDFGKVGMFFPVLILGMFYGLIYRYFVYHYRLKLLGFGMATAILVFGAYNLETSNIKLVGGNLMGFFVYGLFAMFVAPWLWPVITSRSRSARGHLRRRKGKTSEPSQVTAT